MIKNLMAMLVLASMAMAPAAVAEMKIVVLDPFARFLKATRVSPVDAANKEMESEQSELRSMAEQIQERKPSCKRMVKYCDSDKRKMSKISRACRQTFSLVAKAAKNSSR